MNWQGIVLGMVSLVLIGIFHPIVVKGEYYWGTKLWPMFLAGGLLSLGGSTIVKNCLLSGILGVLGCVFLWSIAELFHQKRRVEKGWFPKGPSHGKTTD